MDNALFIGLSQQVVLSRNLDIIAQNLANMSTTAYKNERPLFKSFLTEFRDTEGRMAKAQYVTDYGMTRNLAEGPKRRTENPLDVAISGDGYFVVDTKGGERYTRAGQFRLNDEGNLVTASGDSVLDTARQPINFGPEETSITIAKDGSVSTTAGNKGRILLVNFPDQSAIERVGDNYYAAQEGARPEQTDKAQIQQGMIEDSNVTPILEMTTMIEVMRAYSTSTQLVKSIEETSQRAIRTLGEVR